MVGEQLTLFYSVQVFKTSNPTIIAFEHNGLLVLTAEKLSVRINTFNRFDFDHVISQTRVKNWVYCLRKINRVQV